MARDKTTKVVTDGGALNFALFLAWIGALVYFVQQSDGFWGFVLAVLKSIVWPAFVAHRALELLMI